MDFVYNLWLPIVIMAVMIFAYLLFFYKDKFKTIKTDLTKTFISKLIIERIVYKYADRRMDKYIAFVSIIVVLLTIIFLAFEEELRPYIPE